MNLTAKQDALLKFCREYQENEGRFPTLREMAQATGCASTNAVRCKLNRLEVLGAIVKTARGNYREPKKGETPSRIDWRQIVSTICQQKNRADIAREINNARALLAGRGN